MHIIHSDRAGEGKDFHVNRKTTQHLWVTEPNRTFSDSTHQGQEEVKTIVHRTRHAERQAACKQQHRVKIQQHNWCFVANSKNQPKTTKFLGEPLSCEKRTETGPPVNEAVRLRDGPQQRAPHSQAERKEMSSARNKGMECVHFTACHLWI